VIIFDRLLMGGLRFVLDKVATAADAELSDPDRLREELLAAQMRRELGEIDDEELARVEQDIFARLRELRPKEPLGGGVRVAGAEINVDLGETDGPGAGPETPAEAARAE
jgi:hypothetical protein